MDKARFVVIVNMANGTVRYENEGGLSYFELMGALGIVSLLVSKYFTQGD
jgi:hypothetical protein